MRPLYLFLDFCRAIARRIMGKIARILNQLTGGRLHPNAVTLFALAAHAPVAILIATGNLAWAGIGLIIFGLMDTLDGELARLQGRSSNVGMLLDASTDRIKETLLYSGVAYYLATSTDPTTAAWAVLACGMSLCVSYVKAKGETALSDRQLTPNQKNRLFQDGLLRFEVRMSLLVIGLFIGQLTIITAIIAILSSLTVTDRIIKIARALDATR